MTLCLVSATDSCNVTLSRTSVLASPLESALTKNASANPLGCAVTNSLDLKSPGMNSYKKTGAPPSLCLCPSYLLPFAFSPASPPLCGLPFMVYLRAQGRLQHGKHKERRRHGEKGPMRPKILLIALVCGALATAASDCSADRKRWWAHVQFLADDKLEGRDTGSEGHRKAAEYVAEIFQNAGLQPAGTSGYFQPIKFNVRQIDEEHSRLELVRDGKSEPVKLGEDAMFSMRVDSSESVEAHAVFVGYGLSVPEMDYDDLAGLDLHGKIAVYLAGGPGSIPGPLKAHYQSAAERC